MVLNNCFLFIIFWLVGEGADVLMIERGTGSHKQQRKSIGSARDLKWTKGMSKGIIKHSLWHVCTRPDLDRDGKRRYIHIYLHINPA